MCIRDRPNTVALGLFKEAKRPIVPGTGYRDAASSRILNIETTRFGFIDKDKKEYWKKEISHDKTAVFLFNLRIQISIF